LLAQVLAPAGEAITVADFEGYIIEANDAVESVYRWPKAKIIGQHALKFCPQTDYWARLSQEIWRSINEDGAWDGVVINHDMSGRQFPILLRTRKVTWAGVPYVVSFARPFPFGTPFGLSPKQARCFALLGQGLTPKEIATTTGMPLSTVTTHLNRIWPKTPFQDRPFSSAKLKCLALRCHEAGWDPTMKVNSRLLKAYQGQAPKPQSPTPP
jgi:PAS domain S-box-containing protein